MILTEDGRTPSGHYLALILDQRLFKRAQLLQTDLEPALEDQGLHARIRSERERAHSICTLVVVGQQKLVQSVVAQRVQEILATGSRLSKTAL